MTDSEDMRTLSWRHGMLQVHALGGMFGPGLFLLEDGRQVAPFHVAPWWNEPQSLDLDGMHRGLRGEWPCVPFGYPMPKADFPPKWQAVIDDNDVVADAHGFGAHNYWRFTSVPGADAVSMQIDYPDDHDVLRLERLIRPEKDDSAIELELTIHVRRKCRLPVALHGCFSVPDAPGAVELIPGKFKSGWTHPSTVEPGAAYFKPDQTFSDLKQVPGRSSVYVDAASLPLNGAVEELLQLNDCEGIFNLINKQGNYRVEFQWDASILPSVLLWYSNHGRAAAPWNSRSLSIGIEPTASAFGLSPNTSASPNPMQLFGTNTAVEASPDNPVKITYKIAACALS